MRTHEAQGATRFPTSSRLRSDRPISHATKMQDLVNKPIFIVGSGRSGSSVLTYCLGQHPNILFQEESDWLGPFSIDAAVSYWRGSARGARGQLSAIGVGREEFLALFGQGINKLIFSHREHFQRRRAQWDVPPFTISRSPDEAKSRWVDGAPENSFYICGLRKLFPEALFIHLVQNVTEVVRSLLNFFPDGKSRLVTGEQVAYEDWLRRVTACLEAEQAYGPDVVYRMRYSDMITHPESAMQSLLDFLGEPYAPGCLEPLTKRINSSTAQVDPNVSEHTADPAIVARAMDLSDRLQNDPQQTKTSATVAEKLENEFNQRMQYFVDLGAKYSEAQQLIVKLRKECEKLKGMAK